MSCIDLVISLMCADQNASGVWASSASSAARKRKAVVRERPVAEGVADAVAQLVACLRDALVGSPAVRTRVACRTRRA